MATQRCHISVETNKKPVVGVVWYIRHVEGTIATYFAKDVIVFVLTSSHDQHINLEMVPTEMWKAIEPSSPVFATPIVLVGWIWRKERTPRPCHTGHLRPKGPRVHHPFTFSAATTPHEGSLGGRLKVASRR